jgi:hypothetical protein
MEFFGSTLPTANLDQGVMRTAGGKGIMPFATLIHRIVALSSLPVRYGICELAVLLSRPINDTPQEDR